MKSARPLTLIMAAFVVAIALLALFGLLARPQLATAGIPAEEPSARSPAALVLTAGLIPADTAIAEPAAVARPALAPTAHPILSDLQVRRAIAHCTDKDALLASVYPALTPAQRAALVMDSPILPTSWAYSPPSTTYPYNPATGRALLDAAGWTLAPGAEYRTKGGNELYLTLTSTDAAFRQTFLAVFEEQMRNCGVHVIRQHRNATWVFSTGGLWGRNFELGEFAWSDEEAPDLLDLYGCAHVPSPANNWSGQNYMGWCNAAADAAATQANNTALTQAQRKAAYATFTNLFAADLPSLVLFRRDGSDTWEHIGFNLETYAQEKALGPAGTGVAPLAYSSHDDLPTTVAAPAGAVAELIDLRYTPLVEGGNPPPAGQTFVSAFRLERVQGGVPAERYDLAGPATVTVTYPDPMIRDDYVEDTLALYVWDGAAGAWQPGAETCPAGQQYAALDTAQRTVTTRVCHFSEFALLAVHQPDPILYINFSHDWIIGVYPVGHTINLTLTNSTGVIKAAAQFTTGPIPGWGDTTGFATDAEGSPWPSQRPDIQPGDWVQAEVDNGKRAAVQVGRITGVVDVAGDGITGTVDASWLLPGAVDVECHPWGAPGGAPNKQDTVIPDGADTYACAWDPDTEWDVEPGQDIAVLYREPAGHQVFGVFRGYSDDLIFSINSSHDWVLGEYAPGHTVWITLTNSAGQVKATAELTTIEAVPNWGGTGFATWLDAAWQSQPPDLAPGDWVHGAVDNGRTASAQIGQITGEVDTDADRITGAVDVSWLMPGPLDVFCRGWGAPGGAPEKQDSVIPDGSDPYACAWDPNTEWDVEPGQDLAVSYNEPAGHEIIAVFREPTPRLHVQKWLEGGEVGAGGNVVFTVQYRNEGDAAAENVVITDTLQGLTYLGDTSGFPHTGGGGQVAWALGTVAPGDWVQFSVFAQVTVAAGQRVTNTVEIATSNPYDQGEDWMRRHEWSGDVVPGDTQLNIGKWAWTGDPVAGHDVVFHVNPCNNGGTGSTQVTITDTLPVTLTLKSWWSDAPGWVEVSRSAHQLVVTRPTVAGWRCEAVYVRATVAAAAQPGDPLSNTAIVHAANDATADDNEATWQGNVGAPRINLQVNKGWGHGRLVPGGDLHYWIDYRNDGNLPVGTFRITDTLPVSTTFDSAWRHDAAGRRPLPPVQIGDGFVVWEFAGVDNGFGENFEVVLLADPDAVPGTRLVNTSEITPLPGEESYDDNISTATETLFDHGPNLRVRKDGQWDDWGDTTRRAAYEIRVENVGDEIVYGVTVTDTYPAGMTIDGGLGVNFWRNWTWQDHGSYFTVTLELLEPAWNMGINFGLAAANAPLPFGRVYTNTAQVSQVTGDANPADNIARFPLATGPDLWVEKLLADGDFLPGELVTFTLRFGNWPESDVGYWGLHGTAWLTDTLPAGMSYVSAHQRWCGPDQPEWCVQAPTVTGQDLVWQLWPMGAGHWNEIRLVVRIGDEVTGLDTLTNRVRIASDQPAVDREADTANNRSSYSGMILLPHFAISKAYASSRIAGLPVTYTLTITNVGQALATGVVITDVVPANVTYGSGGGYNAGTRTVTWNVANLPVGGSAQVQFVGTLGHSGQVVNDHYRVAACNQGVVGPWGEAVRFAIAAPAITANFTQSAANVTIGDEVTFTDTSTTNGAAIVAWAWNFGDGKTSTAQHPKHAYTKVGGYTVSQQVTDAAGHTATRTVPNAVTVKPRCLYLPLINK